MAIQFESRIGDLIRELRDQRGLGLNQLADRAEVSRAELSRIENGHRKRPDSEILRKLARALRVEAGMLLSMAGYVDNDDDAESDPEMRMYLALRDMGFVEDEARQITGTFTLAGSAGSVAVVDLSR